MTQQESDKILIEATKNNMLTFDLDSFKLTHPRLYNSILQSIQESFERGKTFGGIINQ